MILVLYGMQATGLMCDLDGAAVLSDKATSLLGYASHYNGRDAAVTEIKRYKYRVSGSDGQVQS